MEGDSQVGQRVEITTTVVLLGLAAIGTEPFEC